MELINVLVAAVAAWMIGAVYYMALARPWTEAAGIAVDENGRPLNTSVLPYILSMIVMVVVAGMLRHSLMSAGITQIGKSILTGLGVGAFFITPWIFLNTAYAGRSFKLAAIDSGYAVLACSVMGGVLALF